ncbi:MAG: hypothetical protein HQK50_14310 [Oligoflexia bacterium]|nr:hypothetical protein [Oligoflexia bacterium]MBF0366743.1 hypothetical protein [Oligoflexia bacterium]
MKKLHLIILALALSLGSNIFADGEKSTPTEIQHLYATLKQGLGNQQIGDIPKDVFEKKVLARELLYLNLSTNNHIAIKESHLDEIKHVLGDQLRYIDVSNNINRSKVGGYLTKTANYTLAAERLNQLPNPHASTKFDNLDVVFAWGYDAVLDSLSRHVCYMTSNNYRMNQVQYKNIKVIGQRIAIKEVQRKKVLDCENLCEYFIRTDVPLTKEETPALLLEREGDQAKLFEYIWDDEEDTIFKLEVKFENLSETPLANLDFNDSKWQTLNENQCNFIRKYHEYLE